LSERSWSSTDWGGFLAGPLYTHGNDRKLRSIWKQILFKELIKRIHFNFMEIKKMSGLKADKSTYQLGVKDNCTPDCAASIILG